MFGDFKDDTAASIGKAMNNDQAATLTNAD